MRISDGSSDVCSSELILPRLGELKERLGERLWLAPSCSLLHVPVDLGQETAIDGELRSWLAFAVQKLEELETLKGALDHGVDTVGAGQIGRASGRERVSQYV